jgi:hypothetical protein
MEYCHKGSPTQKKLKTKASAGKVMLTVFWNSEGVVLGFPEKTCSSDSACYTETLKSLKKRITRKGAEIDDVLLQQDNARSDKSTATTAAISCLEFTVLAYAAYSLDLAPSDLHTEGRPQGPTLQL